MKRFAPFSFLIALLFAPVYTACIDNETYTNDAKGNFEALWRIIDERYCFFDYKQQQYGLDWNEVHRRYAPQAVAGLSQNQQFELFAKMLAELKDGHVNLYAPFDVGRYWSWHENYPSNFSQALVDRYLGTDYKIAAGMSYRILDDNTGYIRCPSFANAKGEGNLDQILLYLAPCNGLIIDLRNNGGGLVTAAEQLAARFTNRPLLVGYMQHKTGRGHNDFSPMREQWLRPSKGIRWTKQTVVLTNRSVYSAANEFVKYMKCCANVQIVGDSTGGGAGLPFSSELPNGWSVRFSASPAFDRHKQHTEFGIAPHHFVALKAGDELRQEDTLIEYARHLMRE